MTINELIELLEDARDEFEEGGDAEVRLMTQQNWPFENDIHGVTTSNRLTDEEEYDEGERAEYGDEIEAETKDRICYIVEGKQLRYGDESAWNMAIR